MTNAPDVRGPKYLRIAGELRSEIEADVYRPGDRLPGETSLLTRWRVSLPTLRQAIGVLRAEGAYFDNVGVVAVSTSSQPGQPPTKSPACWAWSRAPRF